MQNPNLNSQNNYDAETESGMDIGELLRYLLPFWPVAIIAAAFGIFVSYVYLRTQTPLYEVKADILLKDESMSGSNLLLTAATGKSQTYIEDEVQVLQGRPVLRRTIQKTRSQWQFRTEGRLGTRYTDAFESPFYVELYQTDSFQTEELPFSVEKSANRYRIGDSLHAFGESVRYGRQRFRLGIKPGFESEALRYQNPESGKLWVEFYSEEDAIKRLKDNLVASRSKTNAVVGLALKHHSIVSGKYQLQALIDAYLETTQEDKRKKASFTVDFIDGRLDFIGRDLDSLERKIELFKK
jgi:uncharacterized protein involved in exopolysaccharide biosynthesis